MTDNINSPSHYTKSKIEAIDYIRDSMPREAYLGYLEGAVKKYLHRFHHKGHPLEDLKKAQWYLNKLVLEHSLLTDYNPNINLTPGIIQNHYEGTPV